MLTVNEKQTIKSLLERIGEIPDGEIVIANILRGIEGGIVKTELAQVVLKAWSEKVSSEDARSVAAGFGPLSAVTALKWTESEILTSTSGVTPSSSPLWHSISTSIHSPFAAAADEGSSNIKDLDSLVRWIFASRNLLDPHSSPGTPIALVNFSSKTRMSAQTDSIRRALNTRLAFQTSARIHSRRWFWITRQSSIERLLSSVPTEGHADKVVDHLGLVHFSSPPRPTEISKRYIVELKLMKNYGITGAKPSFIFADHNPRFASWTDSSSRRDLDWGNAVDLETYERDVSLHKGGPERVLVTPNNFATTDLLGINLLGVLELNRWGPEPSTALGSEVFADRLRFGRSKADVIDSVISLI